MPIFFNHIENLFENYLDNIIDNDNSLFEVNKIIEQTETSTPIDVATFLNKQINLLG